MVYFLLIAVYILFDMAITWTTSEHVYIAKEKFLFLSYNVGVKVQVK